MTLWTALVFRRGPSAILRDRKPDALLAAAAADVSAVVLGITGGDTLDLTDEMPASTAYGDYEDWLPNYGWRLGRNIRYAYECRRDRTNDQDAMPDAEVRIDDLHGDGDHYAAFISSSAFKGKTRVQQHQMVYAALQDIWAMKLRAGITTSAPEGSNLTVQFGTKGIRYE